MAHTKMKLSHLNPDAFSRFQLTCNEIKKSSSTDKKLKILDIGGASTFLYDFLNENFVNFDLTVVDIVDYDNKPKDINFFLQSADKLEFPDNSFDVVTAIDMLEHIPTSVMKDDIVKEAIRVSSDLIVIAGPCENKAVTTFEKKLDTQNKRFFGVSQEWLSEHFEYGKPTLSQVQGCFVNSGVALEVYDTLPLRDWYISSLANLLPAVSLSVATTKLKLINAEYNKRFLTQPAVAISDIFEEGYRTFFVGRKKLIKKLSAKNPDSGTDLCIEDYIDVIADSVYKTRGLKVVSDDLAWYKTEHERLTNDRNVLAADNLKLVGEIKKISNRGVHHKIEKIIARRKNND